MLLASAVPSFPLLRGLHRESMTGSFPAVLFLNIAAGSGPGHCQAVALCLAHTSFLLRVKHRRVASWFVE